MLVIIPARVHLIMSEKSCNIYSFTQWWTGGLLEVGVLSYQFVNATSAATVQFAVCWSQAKREENSETISCRKVNVQLQTHSETWCAQCCVVNSEQWTRNRTIIHSYDWLQVLILIRRCHSDNPWRYMRVRRYNTGWAKKVPAELPNYVSY